MEAASRIHAILAIVATIVMGAAMVHAGERHACAGCAPVPAHVLAKSGGRGARRVLPIRVDGMGETRSAARSHEECALSIEQGDAF